MRAYICDQCHKQQGPDHAYDAPPDGWYTLTRYTPLENPQFCSVDCLAQHVQKLVLATMEPEAARG